MFNYDRTHKVGDAPPLGKIVGELIDDPGQYQIAFLADGTQIAGPVDVNVDRTRRGRVSAPITNCPRAGLSVVDVTARWTGPGGIEEDGPEVVKVRC